MNDKIVRLFDHPADALRAVDRLAAIGVKDSDMSLIANNREGWYGDEGIRQDRLSRRVDADDLDDDNDALEGAGDGAVTGGVIGAGVGLLAGLGMLAVPGLGPIVAAGWLASTGAGAAAGAATGGIVGGIVGSLTDEGLDKRDAEVYAETIRRGGAAVIVRNPGNRRKEIEQALSDYSADPALRRDYYSSTGWQGYDERAPDFTPTDIERERDRATSYRRQ